MLTFGALLEAAGLTPGSVRLLRHQEHARPGFPTPYVLWRDERPRFERYQETQSFGDSARLRAPWWASFVGLPGPETLFVGIYAVELVGPLPADRQHPVTGAIEAAASCNLYRLTLQSTLAEYAGRLWIEWGKGYRTWIQRADGQPKPIAELRRTFDEEAFPGFAELILNSRRSRRYQRAGWRSWLQHAASIFSHALARASSISAWRREQEGSWLDGGNIGRLGTAGMSGSRAVNSATIRCRSSKRWGTVRATPIY